MVSATQRLRAVNFATLHEDGCFVLPNAWDVPSALLCADAGFQAVGTTSAGVAFAHGFPDGEQIGRDAMLTAVRAIAGRIDLPTAADLEAGYGETPADVAETIRRAVAAGAVGCNLEDSTGSVLRDPRSAAERIAAAVAAARAVGLEQFVVNARTDAFLLGMDPEEALSTSVARGRLYVEAGARCVFVPGPGDVHTAQALVRGIGGAINLMAGGRGPMAKAAELAGVGVRRISLGGSLQALTYNHMRRELDALRASGDFAALTLGGPTFLKLRQLISQALPGQQ